MTNIHFEKLDKLIIKNLIEAKFDIKIAVAWITDLNIISTLEQCKKNGVNVSIVFFNDKINNVGYFKNLYNSGAKVYYTSKLMHNKFCVIDNKITLNGSYNWTNSAKSNNENIQITDSYEIATKFENEFDRILKSSISVDSFFKKKEDDFIEFFNTIKKPISYPNFYKLDLDKLSLRNSISYYLQDIYIAKNLDHIYKFFETEEDFTKFFKHTYSKLGKFEDYNIYVFNRFNENNGFIAIDIIDERNINNISSLSSNEYINSKIQFTNEDIVYFDKSNKIKFLFIGIFGKESVRYDLEKKLILIPFLWGKENFIIKEFEFNLLEKKENYLIISDYPHYFSSHYPISLPYKHYLHLENLEFDKDVSKREYEAIKSNKENEYYKRLREEKELERKKRIEVYKRKNECYIATMVYKNENHSNIVKLRDFRDNFLLNYYFGETLICFYYKTSPWLVKKMNGNYFFKKLMKCIIEKIILKII